MGNYSTILFDMDGVLIDSMHCHVEAFNEVLAPYDIRLDENQISGRSTLEILLGLDGLSLDLDETRKIAKQKSTRSLQIMKEIGTDLLFPDAMELVAKIKNSYDLALCTSASPTTVSHVIKNLMPGGLFKCVVDSSHVRQAKPSPEIYQKACHQLRVEPSRCLVLEDSLVGIQSGIAAGCDVAYINRRASSSKIEIDGIVVVSDLVEILTLLT